MGAGKAGNFGQAGHIAVIHGQFTQHAAGLKARHAHEVNRGLGVPASRRGDDLVVIVDSAAWSARVRYAGRRLTESLARDGEMVTGKVRVRVGRGSE